LHVVIATVTRADGEERLGDAGVSEMRCAGRGIVMVRSRSSVMVICAVEPDTECANPGRGEDERQA
jgi:hypothetical protein